MTDAGADGCAGTDAAGNAAAGAAVGATTAMHAEVWAGLRREPKEIAPKFFYDAAGSALFDRITELPEYYLTRAERALLERFGRPWIRRLGARAIVELGAGSADKTRVLLDELDAGRTVYHPVDISTTYLDEVGAALRDEYPGLTVRPLRSDISRELRMPAGLPAPAVIAFLGSTIGNFPGDAARRLLERVAAALRPADRLLLGVDLKKDRTVLERAYNDASGVTAAFNRNVLRVLNREVGTDFDVDAFEHRAHYDEACGCIEMQLVARAAQTVAVPGCGAVLVAAGEAIRTEISMKFDRPGIEELFDRGGLVLEHWFADEAGRFALAVGRADS
jgi:L-histidine Nalpha-methyltransferase